MLAAAASVLIGCQAPDEPGTPTLARVEAQTHEDYERLYDAADFVLRDYQFRLDRQDRQTGVLTTFPETTANWFELWRPQPENAYYWAEANVGTVRRQAKIELKPARESRGLYDVNVQVERYRYNLEERQIDNPAAALRLYSNAAPTVSGKMDRPSQSGQLMLLGRDEPMETRVLTRVLSRYGGRVVTESQPAPFGVE